MLSLTSIRRAVSRARPRLQDPLRVSASVQTRRHNSDFSLDNVASDLMSKGNAPLEPTSLPNESAWGGGFDLDEAAFGPEDGFHLQRNKFLNPNQLTHKALMFQKVRRKEPTLGPSRKESERLDMFHQLQIDPLNEAFNSRLLSGFVTNMGKIKPRSITQLTWRNQRRLGKAIRRAKMMGVIPVLSRRSLVQDDRDY